MNHKQKSYLHYLDAVATVIQDAKGFDTELAGELQGVQQLQACIQQQELLVPVVGAFSAGKSSLLNAIIGQKALPVALTPETAIPTELRHDTRQRLEAVFANGSVQVFAVEELSLLQARAAELQVVRIYLDCPNLKELAPLVLVDMPGFNSPLDAHNKAIAHYIGQGAHYLFVVSVEEGGLHHQIVRRMDEVASLGRDFSVCVNKADLKPPADVRSICTYITEQLDDEGLPAKVCAVSDRNPASVQALLAEIDPDALIASLFLTGLQQQHATLDTVLYTALEGLQRDKADNAQTIAEMEAALLALEQERDRQASALNVAGLEQAVDDVMHGVRNQLTRAVDDMARAALRSQDELARIVSDEVRSSLLMGLKRATDSLSVQMVADFSQQSAHALCPEVHLSQSRTDGLVQILQAQLLPSLLSAVGNSTSEKGKGGRQGIESNALLVGAMAVSKFIPHPILKVAVPTLVAALPALLNVFMGGANENQKLEQAKEAIRTQVLPDVERRLRPEVGSFLLHAQEQTLQMVAQSFEQQIKAQKEVLASIMQDAALCGKDALIASLEQARSKLGALAQTYL